jgi:hypothetical protein
MILVVNTFCGTSERKCDIKAKTFLCNKCPVYAEYGLKGLYYCDKVSLDEIIFSCA